MKSEFLPEHYKLLWEKCQGDKGEWAFVCTMLLQDLNYYLKKVNDLDIEMKDAQKFKVKIFQEFQATQELLNELDILRQTTGFLPPRIEVLLNKLVEKK